MVDNDNSSYFDSGILIDVVSIEYTEDTYNGRNIGL